MQCQDDDGAKGKITESAWLKYSEMEEDISEVIECLQLVLSAHDEVKNILRLRDAAALSFLDLLDKVSDADHPRVPSRIPNSKIYNRSQLRQVQTTASISNANRRFGDFAGARDFSRRHSY